jgi:hypothetical protein
MGQTLPEPAAVGAGSPGKAMRRVCESEPDPAPANAMHVTAFPGARPVRSWLEGAVFALDRWLCRRQGVYEYWPDPQCLFRIQLVRLEDALVLSDGTRVRGGSRILALHLWNEHVPIMGRGGPTVGWARRVNRAVHVSLRELVRHLAAQPGFEDIVALCGDMRVSSAARAKQFARVLARYGFEPTVVEVDRRGLLRRIGDTVFILMLVLVTNPATLRGGVLRHVNVRVFLSRAVLEARYQ